MTATSWAATGLSKRSAKIARDLLTYVALTASALVMTAPFVFMVTSSLKTDTEVLRFPPSLIPQVWDFTSYTRLLDKGEFGQYFLNSAFVSIGRTVLVVATSALAAYAFSRMEFPASRLIFVLFLSTMMLPGQVTLIPVYVLTKRMPLIGGNDLFGNGGTGLMNTYWGLIIPGYVSVTGIFLLRQFMRSLPRELDDAARIDGCSEFRIFHSIILPLSKPALATLAVLTFQGVWNDFLWPLLVGQRKALWTVQVALAHMRSGVQAGSIRWPEMLAATVVATLPIILIFLFAQRYFMRGIALTGLK
jgi:multiple sugar transport system permease protein